MEHQPAGRKGIRAPKFSQVGQSLADILVLKFCMLDVGVIRNTNFHGKDRSKNNPTCENAVARTHGSWMLQVMGSCVMAMCQPDVLCRGGNRRDPKRLFW